MTPVWVLGAASVLLSLLQVLAGHRRVRRAESLAGQWLRLDSPEQQRAWLRHPSHRPRCCCHRYGLPMGIARVVDGDADHTPDACWPRDESLFG